jgi:hypothetical protein
VEEYATWHLSRVGTESYRENVRKARIFCTARRFVGHTRLWLKEKERETVYIYIYCKCIAYILEVMRLD